MVSGSKSSDRGKPGKTEVGRDDRLKAALKANLARRKGQARVRAEAVKAAGKDRNGG